MPILPSSALMIYFKDYEQYHQTRGNKFTHLAGIPLVLFSLLGLLAHVVLWNPVPNSHLMLDLGILLVLGGAIFSLKVDLKLGIPFSLYAFLNYLIARHCPLAILFSIQAAGWFLQLWGHYRYEKKSPAFLTTLEHLFVGPMWIFAWFIGYYRPLVLAFFILMLPACDFSCSQNQSAQTESVEVASQKKAAVQFDENYAWEVIKKYESFGPKVPGTAAHQKSGDWMVAEMKKFSTTVIEQKGTAKTFDKKTIPFRNIIVQFNPEAKNRYLLSAHWDNRPFTDEDPKNKKGPTPGVNDGGSGVAVLMTLAKAISETKPMPAIGIDLIFFDLEDWGTPHDEESYCLGTQYWAKNPVPANYQAKFGINYDMVGRIGSIFPVEIYSFEKGAEVYSKLHQAAKTLGYEDFFPKFKIGPIVDDHIYVMQGRGFPMIDLIYMSEDGRFPPEWHTHDDTSEHISRDVLKVVGQTTLQLLWSEQKI